MKNPSNKLSPNTTAFAALLMVVFSLMSCSGPVGEHHPEWKKYFDEYEVEGCMEIYDMTSGKFIDYNPDRCTQRFIPASTFKIFNSIVALQTGAVAGVHTILEWDSTMHQVSSWNHDQDMSEAIKNSTVWYYQEMARRIGPGKMQQYLDLLHYGNSNMTGAIDSFWLNGGLRISCDEQVEFLKDFYLNTHHFAPAVINAVKEILVLEETPGYRLSGKTGWGIMNGTETGGKETGIGWFVGYVEKGDRIYFFATNISASVPETDSFAAARVAITKKVLKEAAIIN